MRRTLILALFACTLTASAASDWQFAGWEGGGCYPSAAFDPQEPKTIYLSSDVAGVWRSDNAGDSWRFVTRGLSRLNVAAVAPAGGATVFAAARDGVFRSDDQGANWSACGAPSESFSFRRPHSYKPLLVESEGSDFRVIAAAADGGVYRSDDGCRSWRALGPPAAGEEAVAALVRTPAGVLWAAGREGVFGFDPTSSHWRRIEGSPLHVTDLTVLNGRLWAAHAAGLSVYSEAQGRWSAVDFPGGAAYRVAGHADTIWAAVNKGWKGSVWVSTDAGMTWQSTDGQMQADRRANPTRAWAAVRGRVAALAVSPDGSSVVRTDWWGVWRTTDGGASWQETIAGAPNTVAVDVYVDAESRVWVASMDNGLLVSEDAGESFRPVFPESGYDPAVQGHVWRVTGLSDGRVWAASSPWTAHFNQVVLTSVGAPWERIVQGLPKKRPQKNTVWQYGYPRALTVHPSQTQRVYLGIDGDDGGGLYLSADGGRTWAPSASQPPSRRVYRGLAVDPADPERIYWGAFDGRKGGVFRSTDGGRSWRRVFGRSRRVLDVVTAPDGRVFAGTEDGLVYMSADRGTRWKRVGDFSSRGAAAALAWVGGDRQQLAVGTLRWHNAAGAGVFLSGPDFKEWQDLSGGLEGGAGVSALAYDPKRRELYVARFGNSVYKRSL